VEDKEEEEVKDEEDEDEEDEEDEEEDVASFETPVPVFAVMKRAKQNKTKRKVTIFVSLLRSTQ
jgi:hypothetical protein